MGPESQICSRIRTQLLTSCEMQGGEQAPWGAPLQEETKASPATLDSVGSKEIVGGKALPTGKS